jgi:hypothetical protein
LVGRDLPLDTILIRKAVTRANKTCFWYVLDCALGPSDFPHWLAKLGLVTGFTGETAGLAVGVVVVVSAGVAVVSLSEVVEDATVLSTAASSRGLSLRALAARMRSLITRARFCALDSVMA